MKHILLHVHLRGLINPTGVGRVCHTVARSLAVSPDIELAILADKQVHDACISELPPPWPQLRYILHKRPNRLQQAQWTTVHYPKAEALWPAVDVVHCMAESYVPTRRARLSVTLHDAAYYDGGHPATTLALLQRLKWRYLFRVLARHVDRFHTVSNFSAERIAHYFPAIRSRLHVVYNAVAPEFFAPPPQAGLDELERLNLADGDFVLLPGGLSYRKNTDLVLTAWPIVQSRFPGARLIVCGEAQSAYIERLSAMGTSAQYLGYVGDALFRALLSKAAAVWFPSRYEGFGLPLAEAMASGTAVLASRCAALPEIAGDAALLMDPFRPHEHADALIALLEDTRTREHFRRLGRMRARRFDLDVVGAEFRAFLEN